MLKIGLVGGQIDIDVCATTGICVTTLHYAARNGDFALVKKLIQLGCEVEQHAGN